MADRFEVHDMIRSAASQSPTGIGVCAEAGILFLHTQMNKGASMPVRQNHITFPRRRGRYAIWMLKCSADHPG
jgi:hypothetical protein